MPIGAETFLSPALQPVFDKLFSVGEDLLSKLTGGELHRTLRKWKRQLRMIETLLVDAEQKQYQSKAVKTWLNDLQDLAYDMEDILEYFAIQVQAHELNYMDHDDLNIDDEDVDPSDYSAHPASALGVFGSANIMVKSISDSLSTMFKSISPCFQSKIDDITERLQDIQTQTQYLGFSAAQIMQQQTFQTEALARRRESTSLECEPKVYGRDDTKQEIITLLLRDDQSDENYAVIPIVGKGGIGKTTLAQYIYNDEQELKGHFDLKAWVCVSDVFDVQRITTTICKQATTGEIVVDFGNLNEAQEELKKVLTSKKFLIVLDDIWSDSYIDWNQLQTPLRHAANGSRVIMTTRNEKIARMMINTIIDGTIINLEGLSDNDCWSLFEQHVNNDFDITEMRDEILEKCKGLPLAAKALGGLLKKTDERRQCQKILKSKIWSEESSVLPVLRLSYHHLASHLKRIFAYFAVFPKDYVFEEMEVVLLWMAQDFLPDNQAGSMEDIGHDYLLNLVSRSLLDQSPSNKGRFSMHDLTHDLSLWAAGDICYVIDTMDRPQRDLKRTRHVYVTRNATTLGNQLPVTFQLRTFYSHRNGVQSMLDVIHRFCYIHTLRLTSDLIRMLPECIGDLKHLRFLSLKFSHMQELPKSISNLWNLQTLCLMGCSNLKKVPNIRFLGKLRHFYISFTSLEEMPMGIEKLTILQSLDEYVLGDGRGERARYLKNLNHLQGNLAISGLENVSKVQYAKEAQLHKKYGLDKLSLKWGTCRDKVDDNTKRDVLEQLKPHTSIQECKLIGYKGLTLPAWLGDPSFKNMTDIILVDCEKCECMPPLGQLPSLKNLRIAGMHGIKQISPEFYGNLSCSNPFPALRILHISDMKSWEKWLHTPVDDSALPYLKELAIQFCPLLQGDLPPHLPSLKTLVFKECKELIVSLQSLPLLEMFQVYTCNMFFESEGAILDSISGEKTLNIDGVRCSSPCQLSHLTKLIIWNCPSLITLPEGLLLPALEHLEFWYCENMASLPSQLHKFTSVQILHIRECPKLQGFPEGGLPMNLKRLEIEYVNIKQKIQEWGLHRLHSLQSLYLKHVGISAELKDLSLPTSLSSVSISAFQKLNTISSCSTFWQSLHR